MVKKTKKTHVSVTFPDGKVVKIPTVSTPPKMIAMADGTECRAHGGHEPVIIIVDGMPITIDPGDPGSCDGE